MEQILGRVWVTHNLESWFSWFSLYCTPNKHTNQQDQNIMPRSRPGVIHGYIIPNVDLEIQIRPIASLRTSDDLCIYGVLRTYSVNILGTDIHRHWDHTAS